MHYFVKQRVDPEASESLINTITVGCNWKDWAMTFVLEMPSSITVLSVGSYRKSRTLTCCIKLFWGALSFLLLLLFFDNLSFFCSKSFSLCVSHQRNSRTASYLGWADELGPPRPSGYIWEQSKCLSSLQRTKNVWSLPSSQQKEQPNSLSEEEEKQV